MPILNRAGATFIVATKRILSQPWMALITVIGMIFAISLTMSVPLYASSVYNRIFLQRVGYVPATQAALPYPPFTFLFSYDSPVNGNLQWENLQAVNNLLKTSSQAILKLPVKAYTRYFSTDPMAMFPDQVKVFPDTQEPLIWSSVAVMDDLQPHITITEGSYPKVSKDGPIEVLIYGELADEMGFQVGEVYNLFAREQMVNEKKTTVTIPVRISGMFEAKDPTDEYWFIKPQVLKERLMVPEETFVNRISPQLSNEIYGALWCLRVDGTAVRPEQAGPLVNRILDYQKRAGQALPKIRLITSPINDLYSYQRSANLLTVLLFAFSIPIFGLLLAFIAMTAGMTVERQRNEIAVMRSRGAAVAQMTGMALVESLLLGAVALAISLPVSSAIALAIGKTRSFLDFTSTNPFDLIWSPTALYFGLGAILVTMLARLLPTIKAARATIVSYKRDRARSLRAPFWQRMWLDVLLLIPAGYGLFQLRQTGSIDFMGASIKGDPFTNPLLIMVPALTIFSLSLIFLRIMPFAMRIITWVAVRTRSVGLMMAARHLARTPSSYTLPLVLLILTLSLSAFTATLAGTLDHHLYDQMYYQIGADANFTDLGDSPSTGSSPTGGQAPAQSNALGITDPNPPGWLFLPVSEYTRLPGVTDATRVGRYEAIAQINQDYANGEVMGVDWTNLPNIAFWRPDFADLSLGELMNRLAAAPDGLLVDESILTGSGLQINDPIKLRITTDKQNKEIEFRIVGTFRLFPTYYPGQKPLAVANLDYIFESVGGEYPYNVWLKTNGPADIKQLERDSITILGARAMNWEEPVVKINREQSRPERQGLFGVLSVGFGSAALLTVLGFMLYALFSYQRRFVELGVLRAVGLSAGQMTALLAAELAFLILMGGMIGTALGVWVSNNFIPYLQIGSDLTSRIPPYVVFIAWPAVLRVYILFGILFVGALVTLIVLLRRMKLFQAIKMGESV